MEIEFSLLSVRLGRIIKAEAVAGNGGPSFVKSAPTHDKWDEARWGGGVVFILCLSMQDFSVWPEIAVGSCHPLTYGFRCSNGSLAVHRTNSAVMAGVGVDAAITKTIISFI